jgi:transcriptional regulator with XRE-family HTH domain
MTKLASTIREIRKRTGLSMAAFGQKLGTDHTAISRYEAGRFVPTGRIMLRLLDLAEGDERIVILGASLGAGTEPVGELDETLVNARAAFDARLLQLKDDPARRARFMQACMAIAEKKELPETIYGLIYGWIRFHNNPKIRKLYDEFATEIEKLTVDLYSASDD